MATLAEQRTQVIEVYIASFNRAPDADGLTYWVNNISENGWIIEAIAKSMFESSEVAQKYPSSLSNDDYIDEVYNNVLNRDPDTDGKAYWLEQMNNGITKDEMVIAVLNGANADTGGADDKLVLGNKKIVGEYFAVTLALNDLTQAKSTMALVTKEDSTVVLAKDKQDAFKQSLDGVSLIEGSEADDLLFGTSASDYIFSWGGDDTINTDDGDNVVVAGAGIDSIYAGEGNDTIYGREGNDTIYANKGDDIINGDEGNDSIHGEAGIDTINGGDGDDYIYGDDDDDILSGNIGNDYMFGGSGSDKIYGNEGSDIINTGEGINFVDAGDGDDTIYGGTESDTIYGGAGNDTIYGDDGVDLLDGLTGNDTIYAGKGDDKVNGNDGDDILYGSEGIDIIDGEKGKDTIYGGAGADVLTGGEDEDTFVIELKDSTLTSLDYITDFEFQVDKIKLVNQGAEVITTSKISVVNATTLTEAANAASTGDGTTNALVKWFIYEDYTYIVEDMGAGATFDNTTDLIVKLQGIVDLTGLSTNTILY